MPAALADNITQRGFKYTFRTASYVSRYVEMQFKFLRDVVSIPASNFRVAILHEDTLFGQMAAIAQRRFAKMYGFPVVADVAYSARQLELRSKLGQLLRAKPYLILLTPYLADSVAIARQLDQIAMTPPVVFATGAGPKDPQFIPSTGKLSEKWLVMNEWADEIGFPLAERFNRKFMRRFGHMPDGITVMNYASMFVLHEALMKADVVSRDGVRAALSGICVTTEPVSALIPTGQISFDQHGQNLYTPIVTQIIGGKHVAVWPPVIAVRQPVLEFPRE